MKKFLRILFGVDQKIGWAEWFILWIVCCLTVMFGIAFVYFVKTL